MKPKIFGYQDHTTSNELAELALKAVQQVNKLQRQLGPNRERIIREIKLQKLKHIENLAGMEAFEAVDRDRFPKLHHSFISFVNQSASEDASTTNDILVTWNAPIKLRLIFIPDVLT